MPGLLTRRLLFDLVATTALALLGVTGVMTLVLAMVEGNQRGLDPATVLRLLPFLIPAMLPYTLPTCLLYACTVVYGGMSGGNEVTAVKAGGIPPLRLAWPGLALGALVSVAGLAITDRVIPACKHAATKMVLDDARNAVLAYLKNNGNSMEGDGGKFRLHARQIRGNELLQPIVKLMKDDRQTQMTINADRAELDVTPADKPGAPPTVALKMFNAFGVGENKQTVFSAVWTFPWPVPESVREIGDLKIENLTNAGCLDRSAEYRRRALQSHASASFDSALDLFGGNPAGPFVPAPTEERKRRSADFERCLRKSIEAAGEVHLRAALSLAGLGFVMLGVPLSILLQRRDSLQTFFVCFVPIVTLYYPLTILAFNAFKELRGLENYHSAAWILWAPLGGLLLAALAALRKLARS